MRWRHGTCGDKPRPPPSSGPSPLAPPTGAKSHHRPKGHRPGRSNYLVPPRPAGPHPPHHQQRGQCDVHHQLRPLRATAPQSGSAPTLGYAGDQLDGRGSATPGDRLHLDVAFRPTNGSTNPGEVDCHVAGAATVTFLSLHRWGCLVTVDPPRRWAEVHPAGLPAARANRRPGHRSLRRKDVVARAPIIATQTAAQAR